MLVNLFINHQFSHISLKSISDNFRSLLTSISIHLTGFSLFEKRLRERRFIKHYRPNY